MGKVKTIEDIKNILEEHKNYLKENYYVKEIGIFGSFVKGKQNKRSDVDILVEFSRKIDVYLLIDLEDYLTKLLRRKVEIVRKEVIRPELKEEIFKEVVYI